MLKCSKKPGKHWHKNTALAIAGAQFFRHCESSRSNLHAVLGIAHLHYTTPALAGGARERTICLANRVQLSPFWARNDEK